MKTLTATFNKDKNTTHTVKFIEEFDAGPPIIGTVYVQKWVVGDATRITVTVTVVA